MVVLTQSRGSLLYQTDLLKYLLGYHVSATVYPTVESLVAAKTVKTITNDTLAIST
jgi:hypothetical protein